MRSARSNTLMERRLAESPSAGIRKWKVWFHIGFSLPCQSVGVRCRVRMSPDKDTTAYTCSLEMRFTFFSSWAEIKVRSNARYAMNCQGFSWKTKKMKIWRYDWWYFRRCYKAVVRHRTNRDNDIIILKIVGGYLIRILQLCDSPVKQDRSWTFKILTFVCEWSIRYSALL